MNSRIVYLTTTLVILIFATDRMLDLGFIPRLPDRQQVLQACVFVVIFLIAIALYFLPTLLAFQRHYPHKWLLAVGNSLFGATLLGWFICLAVVLTCENGEQSKA